MVQGVGGTGSSGSISHLTEYQVYYPMYQSYCKSNNSNMDFESWLVMKGYYQNFNQQVENYIETGNSNVGDGSDGNTLNAGKHLSNGSGAIYQSTDEDCYYEFDYDNGTYKKLEGNEEVAKALGMPNGTNIDTINFGYNTAVITDYTFGNLDDGQDSKTSVLAGNYANVTYTNQEFDIHYILNALLMDETDPQYNIAKNIFDDLVANINQWMPQSDMDELDEIAAQYGTNSAEYKAKLQEILLKNLDQANEWVEDHNHVKNVNAGSLTEVDGTEGTDSSTSTDGTTSGSDSTTSSIPDYDITNVLTTAGLSTAYSRGDKRKVESTDNSEGSRRKELEQQMDADLTAIANALVTNLGDQMTDEMQTYINKAVAATVADSSLIKTWSEKHGFLNMHKKTLGEYSIKEVADKFFAEFNSLCANNGKTTAEVEAEKKAAEEKAAREKEAYKGIYTTSMTSVANEAGVNKDIQVVNVNSASEIQAKAESEILTPIKNKIVAKYGGQITASELQSMLDRASDAALSDCTEWATTSNNYVYTIDADKLISKFESNVKTLIQNKGYSF